MYPLAFAGGCLAATGDWPSQPDVSSELWPAFARLAAGVSGFAVYFAIAFMLSGRGRAIDIRLNVSVGAVLRAAVAAFCFASAFLGLTLSWLYNGSIQFFGTTAAAQGIAVVAVTLFICSLTLPFVGTSALLALMLLLDARVAGGLRLWLRVCAVVLAPACLIASVTVCHEAAFGFAWFEFGQWLLDIPAAGPLLRGVGARWGGMIPLGFAAALAPLLSAAVRSAPRAFKNATAEFSMPRTALVGHADLRIILAPLVIWSAGCLGAYLYLSPPAVLAAPETHSTNRIRLVLIAGVPAASQRSPRERIALYLAETLRLLESTAGQPPVDLILWPETVADENIALARSVLLRRLQELDVRADLWTGARARAPQNRAFNTLYSLRADRTLYHKRRLVPFTERLPAPTAFFRWLVFDVLQLNIRSRDLLAPGPAHTRTASSFLWRGPAGEDIAVHSLICYETAFAELRPEPRRPGVSGLILNPGNESWFQSELLKRYTLRQARTRALESGLPLVRIVSDGYSGGIDGDGRIKRLVRDASGIISIAPGSYNQ